jgi:hypothetical protein
MLSSETTRSRQPTELASFELVHQRRFIVSASNCKCGAEQKSDLSTIYNIAAGLLSVTSQGGSGMLWLGLWKGRVPSEFLEAKAQA